MKKQQIGHLSTSNTLQTHFKRTFPSFLFRFTVVFLIVSIYSTRTKLPPNHSWSSIRAMTFILNSNSTHPYSIVLIL
ncbi:MAG: hypothetical protein NTY74_01530 [Ignavibacteriae bacterium]|nr:hypothetical protein [Ignavibacteriota bacterium]